MGSGGMGKTRPDHAQTREVDMDAVTMLGALLFVALLAYLLARAFVLVGPPRSYRHRR
jgi:hypothetical protein